MGGGQGEYWLVERDRGYINLWGMDGKEESRCLFPLPTITWRPVLAALLAPPLLD